MATLNWPCEVCASDPHDPLCEALGLRPIVRPNHTAASTHYGFVLGCSDCEPPEDDPAYPFTEDPER